MKGMSENNQQKHIDRKKRVRILKRMIIMTLVLSILTPCVLCVILFGKVNALGREVSLLNSQLGQLQVELQTQAAQLSAFYEAHETDDEKDTVPTHVATAEAYNEELKSEKTEIITSVIEKPEPELPEEHLHKVYLTFDDGPSIYTNDILDILDRYDVKATFFVVGKESEEAQAAMRRIVEDGHTLGMHSYSHIYRDIYHSVDNFSADFEKLKEYLKEVTGTDCKFYRFPGGSSNDITELDIRVFGEYLESQGVTYFDWNAASGDGRTSLLSVDELTANSLKGLTQRETTVILLHDAASKRSTVEALPVIIENILALEDTVILPITEETEPVQHIQMNE